MRREGRAVEGAILTVCEIPTRKQVAPGHFPINAVHPACECTQNITSVGPYILLRPYSGCRR